MRCGDLHDRPQAGSEGPHRRLARAGGQSQFEHADILPPTSLGEIVVANAHAREGPRGHLGWSRSGIVLRTPRLDFDVSGHRSTGTHCPRHASNSEHSGPP